MQREVIQSTQRMKKQQEEYSEPRRVLETTKRWISSSPNMDTNTPKDLTELCDTVHIQRIGCHSEDGKRRPTHHCQPLKDEQEHKCCNNNIVFDL